jgi:hypothetical protein
MKHHTNNMKTTLYKTRDNIGSLHEYGKWKSDDEEQFEGSPVKVPQKNSEYNKIHSKATLIKK